MSTAIHSAVPLTTEFRVRGMTCQNCARHATEALQGVAGVSAVQVVLPEERAVVRWQAGVGPDVAAAIAAVKKAGFAASVLEKKADAAPASKKTGLFSGWGVPVVLGSAVLFPLLLGDWLFGLHAYGWFAWLGLILATPVQFIAGARFYRGAWSQLQQGRSNMDTLVALGSTTAFGYSVWALFSGHGGHVYFMEAVGIITLVSIGHWLEGRVSARASDSLRHLLELAPPTARLLAADGTEKEVPLARLQAGQHLVLRPGDRIPTDGVVREGASAVDEAMLTGEALPVEKKPGEKIYGGTTNLNGRLVCEVTATGEATALAHIIAAVQRAQSSRADIQRLGDRVSNIFVPIVVGIALLTALWWGLAYTSAVAFHDKITPAFWLTHIPADALAAAFVQAAAVLIVACPCAMGLATPAALMVAANVAARRGILLRDGVALEKAGKITTIIFDKTGTLTTGQPTVAATADLRAAQAAGPVLLEMAAALAHASQHPLSQAVARAATPAAVPWEDWRELRGSGVTALTGGQRWRLGSLPWLEGEGISLAAAQAFVEKETGAGATVLGLAVEKNLSGVIALRDALKPNAAAVVAQLQARNLRVCLLTGDNPRTAEAVAKSVGIPLENVRAQIRPEQKAAVVQAWQQQGEKVAFVGDGLNDGPALEQADLGIAVSRASDVARAAADMVLLQSELTAIPEAMQLAEATLRTIKQNLFWAFFYNAAAIPLAALGLMSPLLCAATMGLSDIVVIGNALRLRRGK